MADSFQVLIGRSASRVLGAPLNQSAPPRRTPVGASGDAILRWGAASRFEIFEGGAASQPIFVDPPSDDDQDDDNPLDEGLVFTETAREVTVVRVSNPLDANNFVDVEVIDQISFRGPDGIIRTFVLNN